MMRPHIELRDSSMLLPYLPLYLSTSLSVCLLFIYYLCLFMPQNTMVIRCQEPKKNWIECHDKKNMQRGTVLILDA